MTLVKSVLGIIPGLQATSLVGHNLGNLKGFDMKPKKDISMKKPIKNIVKTGVVNITGVGLIKPTVSMINKL